jgi:hypothetical protein
VLCRWGFFRTPLDLSLEMPASDGRSLFDSLLRRVLISFRGMRFWDCDVELSAMEAVSMERSSLDTRLGGGMCME